MRGTRGAREHLQDGTLDVPAWEPKIFLILLCECEADGGGKQHVSKMSWAG